jgi:hypothetical protein
LDFKDLKDKLDKALANVLNKETFDGIGKITSQSIKNRTRLGKGVSQSEGSLEQLKPLADSTKKIRTSKKKSGKLSSQTAPAKSNLTETGQMLDSIKYQSSATEVRIYIEGSDNQKKATDQANQGRKFMNLSKSEVNEVLRFLQNKIKDSFNKG